MPPKPAKRPEAPPVDVADPSSADLQAHDATLLHLLLHRNKNQHRQAHWWRYAVMLRKVLGALQSAEDDAAGEAQKERMRRIVPDAYAAFTGLIAHGQYPKLGMVLLGVLGRTYSSIGPGSESEGALELEVTVDEMDVDPEDAVLGDDLGEVLSRPLDHEILDFGEAIARRDDDAEVLVDEAMVDSPVLTAAAAKELETIPAIPEIADEKVKEKVKGTKRQSDYAATEAPAVKKKKNVLGATVAGEVKAKSNDGLVKKKKKVEGAVKGTMAGLVKKKKKVNKDDIDDIFG
ncbi:hypothetical protein SAICODRAFT_22671 [Saitoella complicata NRRL Y-17804]|uniref:RNase MRP protein 1 RNA binding domain-containing protein n=1 Tax=Saitoella complicata (strain BCRC 22490 / CBS 7301 / JCM 7358 / NBRC 10748 / NRRL Y-17804) TaxID=698492 RepID=A0A0E9NNM7_SAICN|nr:uncharacterized protein SAICODRAFT_22671 [Saitoella complicata NRRL Y-17804]ODQ56286.1 hypothetical protein SAICODRAFT_22671 [Saitoella complicata NRRL Y-17804]GAO51477.1 hypothetical protein G7K_5577-t1 [Saitoella complicata NRRL Y-17804]